MTYDLKNHIPGIFFEQSIDGSIQKIGPNFENSLGIPSPELNNTSSFQSLVFEDDWHKVEALFTESEKNKKPQTLRYRLESPASNRIIYVEDYRIPVLDEAGFITAYEGYLLNVSRQHIAENRLQTSIWKENLATLTAGLIHDFSNMIAGIHSLSELYYSTAEKDTSLKEALGHIKKNSLEAGHIIKRIINLNRDTLGEQSYCDLEQTIQNEIDLIQIVLSRNITLETQFTGKEILVYFDTVGFRQMLINLATNAKDAIQGKGTVSISVSEVSKDDLIFDEKLSAPKIAPQNGVKIIFSDSGEGIENENIENIFEPFFSTKAPGKGTGFGLYNIRTFLENCHGNIYVKSTPRKGTQFHIYIPTANSILENICSQNEVEIERKRCLVYADKDPSSFEITRHLIDSEWEVISFSDHQKIEDYLSEAHIQPDAFLAIDMGSSFKIEPMIENFRKKYPKIKRSVQVLGRSPQELKLSFKKKVDLIIDENTIIGDAVQHLSDVVDGS